MSFLQKHKDSMEMNANEATELTSLDHLNAAKLQELDAILKLILALPITRATYAQIIDGKLQNRTAAVSGQLNPSPKATKQYEDFREVFTANALKLDTQVIPCRTLADRRSHADGYSWSKVTKMRRWVVVNIHCGSWKSRQPQ